MKNIALSKSVYMKLKVNIISPCYYTSKWHTHAQVWLSPVKVSHFMNRYRNYVPEYFIANSITWFIYERMSSMLAYSSRFECPNEVCAAVILFCFVQNCVNSSQLHIYELSRTMFKPVKVQMVYIFNGCSCTWNQPLSICTSRLPLPYYVWVN